MRYHFIMCLRQHWFLSWHSRLVTVWVRNCVGHEETGDREGVLVGRSVKVTRKVSHCQDVMEGLGFHHLFAHTFPLCPTYTLAKILCSQPWVTEGLSVAQGAETRASQQCFVCQSRSPPIPQGIAKKVRRSQWKAVSSSSPAPCRDTSA